MKKTIKSWRSKIGVIDLCKFSPGKYRLLYTTEKNGWGGEVWRADNDEHAILMVEASGAITKRMLGKIKPFRKQMSLF